MEWKNSRGVVHPLNEVNDHHLLNIISKIYADAKTLRETYQGSTHYTASKTAEITKDWSDAEFAHRVFPELLSLLGECWTRGLINVQE